MTGRVIDFDRWRAERAAAVGEETKEAPVFRIGGEEYPMPAEPPATVALDAIRLKETLKGADASVPLEALYRIGNSLFGAEVFREICEKNNVGAAELGDLVLMAVSVWQEQVDVDEGEARPNRETRRRRKPSTSSKTGRSSRPTSNGTTTST